MEREKERPAKHPEDEAIDARPGQQLTPATKGPRCPFCHDDLVHGELASDCVKCHTLHHVACFAENRGCSTNACGSHRAGSIRVGEETTARAETSLACAVCKTRIPPDALLARCTAGHQVMDVECYERLGRCQIAGCRGSVELMSSSDAMALHSRLKARILEILGGSLGLLATVLLILATTVKRHDPEVYMTGALFGLFALLLIAAGQGLRKKARRLNCEPPPRPTQATATPPKKDEPGEKDEKGD